MHISIHLKKPQKSVMFKYIILFVIHFSHQFLYKKFSLSVFNNLLLHTYIFLCMYIYIYIYMYIYMQLLLLFECEQCKYRFPYVGSTKNKFGHRTNNDKSTHKKFRKKYVQKDLPIVIQKKELKQKLFYKHYCSEGHQGIEN